MVARSTDSKEAPRIRLILTDQAASSTCDLVQSLLKTITTLTSWHRIRTVLFSSSKTMKISLPSTLVLSQCRAKFASVPDHIFATLWLVCSAIILARSTNLNVMKDYLPQLLANDQTKPCSHGSDFYKLSKSWRIEIGSVLLPVSDSLVGLYRTPERYCGQVVMNLVCFFRCTLRDNLCIKYNF